MNVTQAPERGRRLCVGCGICVLVCPTRALDMWYSPHREYVPRLDASRCSGCGTCVSYCPVSETRLGAEHQALGQTSDPLLFGLEQADCFVGYDRNVDGRRASASGGLLTRTALGLLEQGTVEAVVHARVVPNPVGRPHYAACVSCTPEELHRGRGSVYGPVCHASVLEPYRRASRRLAITGVPCVLRGMRRLFDEHPQFKKNSVTLLGLACSHNVNGQFTDFLAESLGVDPHAPFEVNLRDKWGATDANNYNTWFVQHGRTVVRRNRYDTPFTSLWRGYAFALDACHYCPDFWGRAADVTVKDAWGRWASDPLGRSIVVVRSAAIRELLTLDPSLSLQRLSLEETARSQEATVVYKHQQVAARRAQPSWLRENRRSGFLAYLTVARVSRLLYRIGGHGLASRVVFPMLGRLPSGARPLETELTPLLQTALTHVLRRNGGPIVLFGAGQMAVHMVAAIGDRVEFIVDNDACKQGGTWAGKPVRNPETLRSVAPGTVVMLTSIHSREIARQVRELGLGRRVRVVDGLPIHTATLRKQARRQRVGAWLDRARGRLRGAGRRQRSGKVLVLGGYGYRNVGDEAQLSANLGQLRERLPGSVVKVLTPDQCYTHAEHGGCAVADAPRAAFYDCGESPMYGLANRYWKARFLVRSLVLYANAWLVRLGLPTMCLRARRAALLHELATSDLVFFSGGGYLTGRTLSRLWDGAFFMALARVLRTPVVLSGQTIGVWGGPFNRWFARWGLTHALVVATRDDKATPSALAELGIPADRVLRGVDDALFCEKTTDAAEIDRLRRMAGLQPAEPFVSLNVHFWGLEDEPGRRWLLERLEEVVRAIWRETASRIVCVPMVPSDREAMDALAARCADVGLATLTYRYDFRTARAVIAESSICVTMKHHPIVFALGEGVPVLSLGRGDYYHHKNLGALGHFGLERFHVALDHHGWRDAFLQRLRELWEERRDVAGDVRRRLEVLRQRRERFWERVRQSGAI